MLKSRNFYRIYLPIILISILLPLILDMFIDNSILTFPPGTDDTWIGFWGSYIGALIGASIVFFVAKIQIEEQNKQQMKLLELRKKYEMKKEIRFFYTTNYIDKLEEIINVSDELLGNVVSVFQGMLEFSFVLSDRDNYPETQITQAIRNEQFKRKQYIAQLEANIFKIDHLANYVSLNEERIQIITQLKELIYEYENIEKNFLTYLNQLKNGNEKVVLFGIANDAGSSISRLSQKLKNALMNLQDMICDTDNTFC